MINNEKLDSPADRIAPRIDRGHPGFSSIGLLPLAVLAILFASFSVFANNFFTVRSILNLLVQTSTFTILGIGATLVLVVGCIDFSVGAVIALGGAAMFLFAAMGIPIWISMIAASILCGAIGLVNGFLVARFHLPSFIITFAMAMLLYGLLSAFWSFMSAHAGPIPHPENLIHLDDLVTIPVFSILSHDASGVETVIFPGISWIVIIMAVVAVLSHFYLEKTRFGRFAFLVGSNPVASRFSGLKVVQIKILAFVFASMMAGLVGGLLTSRLGGPPGGAVGYEMIAIECAMIGGASLSGGTGNIRGAVVGSFLISTLAMGLQMMDVNHLYLPLLLNGLILIGAVYLDQIRNRKQIED
jgi:ribose transport system permease protein